MINKRAMSVTSAALALALLATSVHSQTYVYRFKAYVSGAGPVTGGSGGGSGNGGGTDPDGSGDSPDLTPDPFPFAAVEDATPNYPVSSSAALLTRHDGVEVSLLPGREAYYQVCELADCSDKGEGDWISDPTPDVPEGRYVRVATMAGDPGERVEVTLKAGETTSTFAATARVGDPPADFSFTPVTGATEGAPVTSNIVALPNTSAADVHLLPGPTAAYQLCAVADCSDQDDSSWTQSPTPSVPAGRFARIAVEAGPAPDTVTAWLKVGASHGRFDVTSNVSGLPEPFSFTDVTDVDPNVPSYSNVVELTGDYEGFDIIPYNSGETVGGYQICPGADCSSMDGQPFQTDDTYATPPGTWIRMVSVPLTYGDVRPIGIQYGGSVVYFTATAKAEEEGTTLSFTPTTDYAFNTLATSNSVTLSGLGGSQTMSVSGSGSPQVQVNGGTWTSGPATVSDGDTLRVRLTSANSANVTRTATVSAGTVSGSYSVTTMAVPQPNAFTFPDVLNAVADTDYEFDLSMTGMNRPAQMTVTPAADYGLDMRIRINGNTVSGPYPIDFPANGELRLKLRSGMTSGSERSITVTIGARTDTWTVRVP